MTKPTAFSRYARVLILTLLFPAVGLGGTRDQVFRCNVGELHPTQFAVGMAEVREKERKLINMDPGDLEEYKRKHPEPAVKGPGGTLYIIDHHHLARALYDIGAEKTFCVEEADYSALDNAAFWKKMDEKKWVYAYNEYGEGPRPYSELPATVRGLEDDPYRTLAWAVREAGGYKKTDAPFAEFKWADFFRDKFSRGDINNDLKGCTKKAVKMAHSPQASALPGYLK